MEKERKSSISQGIEIKEFEKAYENINSCVDSIKEITNDRVHGK